MKWANGLLAVLPMGVCRAQVRHACSMQAPTAQWVQYYAAMYQVPVELVAAIIDASKDLFPN